MYRIPNEEIYTIGAAAAAAAAEPSLEATSLFAGTVPVMLLSPMLNFFLSISDPPRSRQLGSPDF